MLSCGPSASLPLRLDSQFHPLYHALTLPFFIPYNLLMELHVSILPEYPLTIADVPYSRHL